jgi:hypothetical protein
VCDWALRGLCKNENYCKFSHLGSLLFQQERGYFLVKYFGRGSSNVFLRDPAIAVEEERDGQSQHSSILFANFGVAHHDGVIHMELLRERADWVRAVVHRDADDLKSLGAEFVLQLNKMGNLLAARNTPCGPEIEKHDVAAVGRQSERWAIHLG